MIFVPWKDTIVDRMLSLIAIFPIVKGIADTIMETNTKLRYTELNTFM